MLACIITVAMASLAVAERAPRCTPATDDLMSALDVGQAPRPYADFAFGAM